MRKLDERSQVKEAIRCFIANYGEGSYSADQRGRKVGAELAALDPNGVTADQLTEIIGTDNWARPQLCDECGARTWNIVEIGGMGDLINLCRECLTKGAEMLRC